ncbi:unnamed protein product [Effrenium voratum]|uniref:Uncharacterized protein n=1 Tax=Effrenium voratum TaxID=2562239 RepID=A0AA36HTG7_9DINO|nr:unnamed protein product [Effrenium voratum]
MAVLVDGFCFARNFLLLHARTKQPSLLATVIKLCESRNQAPKSLTRQPGSPTPILRASRLRGFAVARFLRMEQLPIASFRGPEVNLPWTELPALSVDLRLEDAAQRLQSVQAERRKAEEAVERPNEAIGALLFGALNGADARRGGMSSARAAEAQRLLKLQKDRRFLELKEAYEKLDESLLSEKDTSFLGTRATKSTWYRVLRQNVRKLMDGVMLSRNPESAERQLDETYRWYQQSKGPHAAVESGGDFHDFCGKERLALPGSAFFSRDEDPSTAASVTEVSAALPVVAGRPAIQVHLASPRERLKDFSTRQIARPLTARKLKDLGDRTDHEMRPQTPSTTSGGFTARSLVSASTPGPTAVSRPASAMSTARSAISGRCATPRTARHRPQSASSVGLPGTLEEQDAYGESLDDYVMPYPATEAEQRMEKRWLLRRNRAITDKVLGEEQHAAVRDWAERRARVEEEISRNTEATRFQCALARRRYVEPPDADEDIEATVDGVQSARPATSSGRRMSEPPRIDVTQPRTSLQVTTRFADEKVQPRSLNSRIAHLRRIHAHLLDAEYNASDADEPEDEVNGVDCELSAYAKQDDGRCAPRMKDDSDVLAGVCDWWKALQADASPETSVTLDEIRFNQLQEVEEIKRVFARRSVPMNVGVLERALVMPAHKLNPGHLNGIYLVNTKPDLLSNPFMAKKKKPKKKKRGKSAGKGKGNAKSSAKGKKK